MLTIPDKVIDFILKHMTVYTLMSTVILAIFLYLLTPDFFVNWIQTHSGSLNASFLQFVLSFCVAFFVVELSKLPIKFKQNQKIENTINSLNADEMAFLLKMSSSGFQDYPLPHEHPAVQSLQIKSIIYHVEYSLFDHSRFSVNSAYLPFIKKRLLNQ